jgi:hypothetical protein
VFPAGLVGVPVAEPVTHADRTAIESMAVRITEITFDGLDLALYILLSFVDESNGI